MKYLMTCEMNWIKISHMKCWCMKHVFHVWKGRFTYENWFHIWIFHFTNRMKTIHIWNIIFMCEIACEVFVKVSTFGLLPWVNFHIQTHTGIHTHLYILQSHTYSQIFTSTYVILIRLHNIRTFLQMSLRVTVGTSWYSSLWIFIVDIW